jgi:hypothetical protein
VRELLDTRFGGIDDSTYVKAAEDWVVPEGQVSTVNLFKLKVLAGYPITYYLVS